MIFRTRTAVLAALAAAGFAAACTVQQTEIPSLTGPSEFGLSIVVNATPDTLSRDGASQSAVVVTARGPDGSVAPFVPVRLDIALGNVLFDFGTLSAKNLVTGSDGRATAVYTAPGSGSEATVSILATVSNGSNAQTAISHSADIRLVPVGIILPPDQFAAARFSFSPTSPEAHAPVQFNGVASCPGPINPDSNDLCQPGHGVIVNYHWNFGDGTTANGPVVSHTFTSPRSYGVTLTVTNDRGGSGSTTQTVPVGAGVAPTADFVFSPASPVVAQLVQFNASTSRAAPGRTIVEYRWNWGDGDPSVGSSKPTQDHDFQVAGTYNVVLTVKDDVGQETTVVKPVVVGSGNPTAEFTFTPINALLHRMGFDGGASTANGNAQIVSYEWIFGDTESGSGKTVTHDYPAAGSFQVTLIVTDDLDRKGSVTKSVTVP